MSLTLNLVNKLPKDINIKKLKKKELKRIKGINYYYLTNFLTLGKVSFK